MLDFSKSYMVWSHPTEMIIGTQEFKPESSHVEKHGRVVPITAPVALGFFFGGCGYGKSTSYH